MPGQQPAQVFGPNMPSRIAGTTPVVLEPGEVAPTLPWYQPLVPFYPPSISQGGGSSAAGCNGTTADGHIIWQRTPSRCDLLFYQGDDVVIPLYFNDKDLMGDDMSDQKWFAQIRIVHRYQSKLIAEFVTHATYQPGADAESEYTMVAFSLLCADNTVFGQFRWDLYSVDAADLTRFPMPDDLPEDEIWPPPDALRTWLYGEVTIAPRVTSTDVLIGNEQPPLVPYPGPPPTVTVITTGGWCVGPNGRVP